MNYFEKWVLKHIIFSLKLSSVRYTWRCYLQFDTLPGLKPRSRSDKKKQLMIDIHNHLLVFYILNEYELNNSDQCIPFEFDF